MNTHKTGKHLTNFNIWQHDKLKPASVLLFDFLLPSNSVNTTPGTCTSPLCCCFPWVAYLLSRATLLPSTQLSCSWTHSAVLCKSAARPAVGGGLGLLWLASELRLSEVMDGCCLCGGGAGGSGGGACWLDRWSPGAKKKKKNRQQIGIIFSLIAKIKVRKKKTFYRDWRQFYKKLKIMTLRKQQMVKICICLVCKLWKAYSHLTDQEK